MKPEETVYFVMALRLATDHDVESDFIFGDDHFLIEAVERCNMLELTEAENKIKHAFPKHKVMITYMPLFEAFGMLTRIQDLESELAKTGGIAHADSNPSRLRAAFDWEQKHNATIQKGSC
ncbi:hypothetical protein [Acinetobacter haemolyticus]|uniref:hypothetical protein n=1 Tax=Acinetobacter haemolyticus TaxID=29430 RepID=UPI0013737CC9|nr:hypothetical protein [Acinetobacter haemolyticus]NAR91512.1 hypothetical protein [Acinetobacter haemolyticus]